MIINTFIFVRKGLNNIMFPSSFYYWLKKEYMNTSDSEAIQKLMCWWVNTTVTVCDEKDKNWKCKVIVKHCVC